MGYWSIEVAFGATEHPIINLCEPGEIHEITTWKSSNGPSLLASIGVE